MEDSKIKHKNKKKTILIAVTILGILIIIASIFNYAASAEASEGYIPTTARIINIDEYNIGGKDSYRVLIRYNVDGESYDKNLNYYDSNLKIGQDVKIAYHKDSKTDVQYLDKDRTTSVALIILGSAITVIGITSLVGISNRNRKYSRGIILIEGKVTEIFKDVTQVIDGENPLIVKATVKNPKTDVLVEVSSKQLTREQVGDISRGDKINVLLDLSNNTGLIDLTMQDNITE